MSTDCNLRRNDCHAIYNHENIRKPYTTHTGNSLLLYEVWQDLLRHKAILLRTIVDQPLLHKIFSKLQTHENPKINIKVAKRSLSAGDTKFTKDPHLEWCVQQQRHISRRYKSPKIHEIRTSRRKDTKFNNYWKRTANCRRINIKICCCNIKT